VQIAETTKYRNGVSIISTGIPMGIPKHRYHHY